jgi:hypothetical protein
MHSGSDSANAKSYSSRGPGSGSTTLILGTGNTEQRVVSLKKKLNAGLQLSFSLFKIIF